MRLASISRLDAICASATRMGAPWERGKIEPGPGSKRLCREELWEDRVPCQLHPTRLRARSILDYTLTACGHLFTTSARGRQMDWNKPAGSPVHPIRTGREVPEFMFSFRRFPGRRQKHACRIWRLATFRDAERKWALQARFFCFSARGVTPVSFHGYQAQGKGTWVRNDEKNGSPRRPHCR